MQEEYTNNKIKSNNSNFEFGPCNVTHLFMLTINAPPPCCSTLTKCKQETAS